MEFDEIKKIWDAQNNRPLYVIDEKALHNRIKAKMNGVRHSANFTEWSSLLIYPGVGCVLLTHNRFKPGANIFMYLESAWMFATVVYIVVSRIRRIKASRRFDRSIHGDLDHAISLAGYQVRLSRIMCWNTLPIGAITIFIGWEAGKLIMVSAIMLVSFVLALLFGIKGDRINKRKKRELQVLKEKLETDD